LFFISIVSAAVTQYGNDLLFVARSTWNIDSSWIARGDSNIYIHIGRHEIILYYFVYIKYEVDIAIYTTASLTCAIIIFFNNIAGVAGRLRFPGVSRLDVVQRHFEIWEVSRRYGIKLLIILHIYILLHYIIYLSNFLFYSKYLYIDIFCTPPKVKTTAEQKRFCICFCRCRRHIHR